MNRTPQILLLVVAAAVVFGMAQGCARAERPRVLVDVIYGMGYVAENDGAVPQLHPLHMDILMPLPSSRRCPAVLLIHGGGFERGSKEDERQRELADTLVEHGYACFLINYRLLKHHPPAPSPHHDPLARAVHAAVVDARAALRYIHANAARHDVDPERIALIGSSAGAITALAAGLAPPERFSNDGPDYPQPPENHPEVVVRVAAIVNLWGSADFFPELFGPQAPPIMTVHGGQDFRVGLSLAPALNIDAYCTQYGIPHTFYPLPEAGHGAWDADLNGQPLATRIVEFLDTYVNNREGGEE